MADYFFDIHGEIEDRDIEGVHCEDDVSALKFATEQARELLQSQQADPRHYIVCRDETGRVVGHVTLGEIMRDTN